MSSSTSPPPPEATTATSTTNGLFEAREGRDLVWRNLSMAVDTSNQSTCQKCCRKDKAEATDTADKESQDPTNKVILQNVWGSVPAKQVTAILGPSGSGKSSLLNVLSGRTQTKGALQVTSSVRLNQIPVDPTDPQVRQRIAFVAQDDSLQVTATPREAIFFSAKLRNPKTMSRQELETLVENMLVELGLEECADTIVGGALVKGISGGERKRTSVGVELVTRPSLVFLDEATSGLDSFNALKLCQVLSKIAKAGSSVMCTIHQPSSEIFNAFDRLILLNKGRVMYEGAIKDTPSFFEERGFPCPLHYNIADHVMTTAVAGGSVQELEAAGFFPEPEEDREQADEDVDARNEHEKDENQQGSEVVLDLIPNSDKATPGFLPQTKLLLQRELLNLRRDTRALKTRMGMTILISTITGCLFYQIADNDFSQFIYVQSTFGALLMSLMANMFATALPSLLAFPAERPVFLREYQTNHYSVIAYFSSRLLLEIGTTGLQVTISSIITYFLCGFTLRYGLFWAALYVMALASTALSVLIGSSVENPESSMEFLPVIFLPQILFSGFFVPAELMPNWLAWISYISPLYYGVNIVTSAEFGGGRCDGLEVNNCDQLLDSIGADESNIWWYFLVLVLLFVVIRLLAVVSLRRKASTFY